MNTSEPVNSSVSSIRHCFDIPLCNFVVAVFLCNYLLLVPLFTYVPFVAYRARSSSKLAPHSDILTFNCIVFEFFNILALLVYCVGSFIQNETVIMLGFCGFSVVCCGQTMLHVLTCIERHVAVVYPVIYLKAKQTETGTKVGNASIAFVWLSCVAAIGFLYITKNETSNVPSYTILTVCLVAVSYCSVSVLRALHSHAPGENRHRRGLDPSKKRAFNTIMCILVALLLRLVGVPVRGQLFNLVTLQSCLMAAAAIWLNLPSSLVMPLLYLQRMGKLPVTKKNTQEK